MCHPRDFGIWLSANEPPTGAEFIEGWMSGLWADPFYHLQTSGVGLIARMLLEAMPFVPSSFFHVIMIVYDTYSWIALDWLCTYK